jgi:DNA mismatch repair protein MSH4
MNQVKIIHIIYLIIIKKAENSCLHLLIRKIFKNCYLGFLPRKNFSEDSGKEIYVNSKSKELSVDDLTTKYVCMASLSGLASYLETNSTVKRELINIRYYYLDNHLNIPFQSTLDLELLHNNKTSKACGSLFSLFHCQTISGFRLLRSNILQPLALKEELNRRYNAVEELMTNPDILQHLKQYLVTFKNLEIYINKFVNSIEDPSEKIMKQILFAVQEIKNCLKLFQNFREIIKLKMQSEIFVNMAKTFEDKIYDNILEKIDNLVDEIDLKEGMKIYRKQDSIFFLIRSGVNNLLDVSRKTYSDTINDIHTEFERLKITTNDPNIKLAYGENKGYYIILGERFYVEGDYMVAKKVGKKYNCSNIPLVSLSERIKEIKKDLIEQSMKLIDDLVHYLQKNINYLFVLSSYIAYIDMLCCFADYSRNNMKAIRPIIHNNTGGYNNNNININNILQTNNNIPFIMCKNGRHPILEKNIFGLKDNQFIPNDYFFTSHFNTLLLKGANASGKTTYMKQLALTVILAQVGCFVPCDYLELSLRKFLYTKFSSNDSTTEGNYVKEIIEIQKVLTNNLDCSMVLLDEPFDNNENIINFSLSVTILDQFAQNSKSFVIISSHNTSLTQLASFYFNVINGTMNVEFSERNVNFLFKMEYDSIIEPEENLKIQDNYGIILADMLGMNQDIIKVNIFLF